MQNKFGLVIFDLDTLIDNRSAIRENFNRALKSCGYPPAPLNRIDAMIGNTLLEMFREVLPASERHLAPELVLAYRRSYRDTCHKGVLLLDGVLPTLKRMREEAFKLAVATTKADELAKILMNRIGLDKYFDLVTGSKEEARAKPHADIIQFTMRELGFGPTQTALVGDTPVDVATSRNAGTYSIVVTSGVALGFTILERIRDSRPDAIISSLTELPDLLSTNNWAIYLPTELEFTHFYFQASSYGAYSSQ